MVKLSRYRPEQALGDPEGKAPDFLDFRHYEGGKVVESTPGHMVPSVASEKIPSDTTGY
jgi:hypothetical protein